MHRFIASPGQIAGNRVVLTGNEVRHARTVLRLRAGDCVEVLDGEGGVYQVRLTSVRKDRMEGEVLSRETEMETNVLHLRMGQALLKGKSFETVLRKAVELGVGSITPLATERSVARLEAEEAPRRVERWQTLVREAAKQCGCVRIPEVVLPGTLETFCDQAQEDDVKLIFWEEEKERYLDDWIPDGPVSSIAFLVGPEGGFSEQEVERVREAGFVSVGLGPRILKAETAPLVILSLLQYRWGELGRRS